GLPDNSVYSLLETHTQDGRSILWVGTRGSGLARLEDGKWSIYDTKSGLPDNLVISLRETHTQDGRSILWIGTLGGLARLDNGKLTAFTDNSKPALPNNNVYQVQMDSKGRIYIFTNKGIARMTPRSPTPDDSSEYDIYTFKTDDGLPSL